LSHLPVPLVAPIEITKEFLGRWQEWRDSNPQPPVLETAHGRTGISLSVPTCPILLAFFASEVVGTSPFVLSITHELGANLGANESTPPSQAGPPQTHAAGLLQGASTAYLPAMTEHGALDDRGREFGLLHCARPQWPCARLRLFRGRARPTRGRQLRSLSLRLPQSGGFPFVRKKNPGRYADRGKEEAEVRAFVASVTGPHTFRGPGSAARPQCPGRRPYSGLPRIMVPPARGCLRARRQQFTSEGSHPSRLDGDD
jgi:hypothetical protein